MEAWSLPLSSEVVRGGRCRGHNSVCKFYSNALSPPGEQSGVSRDGCGEEMTVTGMGTLVSGPRSVDQAPGQGPPQSRAAAVGDCSLPRDPAPGKGPMAPLSQGLHPFL